MPDTKISDLTPLPANQVSGTDVIPIVDVSDTTMAASGTTKKVTVVDLLASAAATGTNLTAVASESSVVIESSTGTDATIGAATSSYAGLMLPAEKTKLAGIAAGATFNSPDAVLLARSNHTGTQPSSTISDFVEAAQDVVGAMIQAAGGSYNDAEGTITLPAAAALPETISANIIPRQGTLSALSAISNGGGELAVATDADAVVILRNSGAVPIAGVPPSAVTLPTGDDTGSGLLPVVRADKVRASEISGFFGVDLSISTQSAGDAGRLTLSAGTSTGAGSVGGELLIAAGDANNATDSYGGEVYLRAGSGHTVQGSVYIGAAATATVIQVSSASRTGSDTGMIGFFGATPVTKPVVTGSRGGNDALASLLTALAALGIITNNTTA